MVDRGRPSCTTPAVLSSFRNARLEGAASTEQDTDGYPSRDVADGDDTGGGLLVTGRAVASPDSVVVPELTHRLAGAAFDYEDLGLHELKGIPEAARLWRVVGESTARGRFSVPG